MTNEELIAALEAADGPSNKLDVLSEVALFTPGGAFIAIRANNAGTKVIYKDVAGNDVTCWPEEWSHPQRKAATIAAIKAGGEG